MSNKRPGGLKFNENIYISCQLYFSHRIFLIQDFDFGNNLLFKRRDLHLLCYIYKRILLNEII